MASFKKASEVSKEFDVPVSTLHLWHRQGVCPAFVPEGKSMLRYGPYELQRLQCYLELRGFLSHAKVLQVLRVLERHELLVLGEEILDHEFAGIDPLG